MAGERQTILSVDREELHARLKDVAPPLAEVYRGAQQLLTVDHLPGRAYFLSHAAREIANGLPEWITGVATEKESSRLAELASQWTKVFPAGERSAGANGSPEPSTDVLIPRDLFHEVSGVLVGRENRSASRDAVERLFIWLGPGNRYLKTDLQPLIKEWMKLRRWFESATHTRRSDDVAPPDDAVAVDSFERFEQWLAALLRVFFAAQRDLDLVLDDASPNRLPELLPLLVPDRQRRHFFERLAAQNDPAWLGPLDQAGFLTQPPPVTRDGGSFVHPSWPASVYLIKMASNPATCDRVAAIVSSILSRQTIENWTVQAELVDTVLALPPETAAAPSAKMLSWGEGPGGRVARRLGSLAVRLARGKQTQAALTLMKTLLAPSQEAASMPEGRAAEAEPCIGRWGLREIVDKVVPEFIETTGIGGFVLVCQQLAKVLAAEHDRTDPEGEDYSHIWRPIIESEDIEYESARNLLAAAAVRSALQLTRAGTPTTSLLEVLDAQRWRVFRRLAQYLIRSAPDRVPDALRVHLLQHTEFESFHREYRMLLQAGFGDLATIDQETMLVWIEAGPDSDRIRESLAFWRGHDPTPEDVEGARRQWQWQRLGPLTAQLPATWRERQHGLNREFGEPEPADQTASRGSFGLVARSTALGKDDLRTLSVPEIAERLRTWRPPADGGPLVLPPSSDLLAEVIAEEPGRFAAEAVCFLGLKPCYVRGVFNGLESAARQGRRFEWDRVLELASWATTQEPQEYGDPDPWRDEVTWCWTRAAMARLLQAGLARPDVAPPMHLRQDIWRLIESLSDDPPQNRAEATGAAIQYAFWLGHGDGSLFDSAPEVERFLDDQLGPERRDAAELHVMLGKWLSPLAAHAPGWTRRNLDKLLPPKGELWTATWRAYLWGLPPPRPVLSILKDVYVRAVDSLVAPEPDAVPGVKAESMRVQERLAEHLVIAYGRGDLDAIGAPTLLDTFLQRAALNLRRHALWTVGRCMYDDGGQPVSRSSIQPEVRARFQQLWEQRVSIAERDSSVIEELSTFGTWLASGQFEDAWALDQIEHVLDLFRTRQAQQHTAAPDPPLASELDVLGGLTTLAATAPARVSGILERLARLADDGMWVIGRTNEIRQIIETTTRSGNPTAQEVIVRVLDRLGRVGFRDVRDLVPSSDDLSDPLAIPYFLWDQPLTVAQFRERLSSASISERDRMLGLLLREARDVDVWEFTSPLEVLDRWAGIEKHLGRRRALWSLLLNKWQEQKLLVH